MTLKQLPRKTWQQAQVKVFIDFVIAHIVNKETGSEEMKSVQKPHNPEWRDTSCSPQTCFLSYPALCLRHL